MRFGGLWRNADFVKLWSGQTISVFGSLVTRAALPFTAILVLQATPLQIALLGAADLTPGLLVGLVAGVWVDRLRQRPLLILADLGRAGLLVTIPMAAVFHLLRIEHLYFVAFLAGILTVCFDIAYQSYLPSLLRRDELLDGNSKLTASASVAEFGAFSLSGWLVQLFTGPIAILIDAVSFLVSACSLGLIKAPEPAPMPGIERGNARQEIGEGLRIVAGDHLLRVLALDAITLGLFGNMTGAVYLLFVTRDLGFRPGLLGMIFAIGGISSLLGALVATPATARLGIGRTMLLGLLLTGFGGLFLPLARGATLAAALLLVAQQLIGDGSVTVYQIAEVSLRQAITPERLLGRVNASMHVLSLAAMLAGILLGGLLGESIGLRPTLVIAAGGAFLAALWLLLSPLKQVRTTPGRIGDNAG